MSYKSRAKPTGLEPALSRETVGCAGHCATAPTIDAWRWSMARRTNDAPTRESRDLAWARHPPAGHRQWPASSASHMHPSVVKELGRVPKRRSPHPASYAQVGRSEIPSRWVMTTDLTVRSRSLPPARCCHCRTANLDLLHSTGPTERSYRQSPCADPQPRASDRVGRHGPPSRTLGSGRDRLARLDCGPLARPAGHAS